MLQRHTLRLCLAILVGSPVTSVWAATAIINLAVLPKQTLMAPGTQLTPLNSNPPKTSSSLPPELNSQPAVSTNNSQVQDNKNLCNVFIPSPRLLLTKCAPPTTGLRATPIAVDSLPNRASTNTQIQMPVAPWIRRVE